MYPNEKFDFLGYTLWIREIVDKPSIETFAHRRTMAMT